MLIMPSPRERERADHAVARLAPRASWWFARERACELAGQFLHWRAKRDAKAKMLSLQSFLRKGVSLGYVGRNETLKDLKDPHVQRHRSDPQVFAPPERRQ